MIDAAILEKVRCNFEFTNKSRWSEGSKNLWIRKLSTCGKGVVGERLAAEYLRTVGNNNVGRGIGPEHDLMVDGTKYEAKLSCLNETGLFKWLQIRVQDDYQKLFLIGVYPEHVRAWCLPKEDLGDLVFKGILKAQQGGRRHNSQIMYLGVDAESIPEWLSQYEVTCAGGTPLAP